MLEDYVRQYCAAMCNEVDSSDNRMRSIMRGQADFDNAFVQQWLQNYGVFQGIPGGAEIQIVNYIAENFVRRMSIEQFNPSPVIELETGLRANILNQKWLSLASKVLAVQNPNVFPMYDRLVHSSLCTLQWIEPALIEMERIGDPGNPQQNNYEQELTNFYQRYANMIFALVEEYHDLTAKIIQQNGIENVTELRAWDKMLHKLGRAN